MFINHTTKELDIPLLATLVNVANVFRLQFVLVFNLKKWQWQMSISTLDIERPLSKSSSNNKTGLTARARPTSVGGTRCSGWKTSSFSCFAYSSTVGEKEARRSIHRHCHRKYWGLHTAIIGARIALQLELLRRTGHRHITQISFTG